MKKVTRVILIVFFVICSLFTTVYAASNETSKETLKNDSSTHTLLEMKKHEEATIDNLTEQYGSRTYGVTAYILDRVRIYSIPCVFLGIAISAVYQYVIGLKRLDARNIGFNPRDIRDVRRAVYYLQEMGEKESADTFISWCNFVAKEIKESPEFRELASQSVSDYDYVERLANIAVVYMYLNLPLSVMSKITNIENK